VIKVVLFDVDGVLANSGPFSRCLERDYGITQQTMRPFFQGRFRECLVGNADLKESWPPCFTGGAGKGTSMISWHTGFAVSTTSTSR